MRASGFCRQMLPVFSLLFLVAWAQSTPAQTQAAASSKQEVKSKAPNVPISDKFKTAAAATAHCPGDTVVWSSFSSSHVYHLAASKYYGKTKHGAYVCEKDATAFGYHASKK